MIIKCCSIPRQFNAVTPTPLALCDLSCMRAMVLGYDSINLPGCSQERKRCMVEPSDPAVGHDPHARASYPDKGGHPDKGCELPVYNEHVLFRASAEIWSYGTMEPNAPYKVSCCVTLFPVSSCWCHRAVTWTSAPSSPRLPAMLPSALGPLCASCEWPAAGGSIGCRGRSMSTPAAMHGARLASPGRCAPASPPPLCRHHRNPRADSPA